MPYYPPPATITESDPIASAALATHESDTTSVHGIADTADLIVEGDARLTDARTPTAHDHNTLYYTEAEIDTALSGKSDTTHHHDADYADIMHTHDDRYYTEAEVNTALAAKADASHTHSSSTSFLSAAKWGNN